MKKQYKKKPLVSVVIPVFNGADFLEETITSVQKSTFKDFEVLLIDDGSTDHSRKICHRLEKRYSNVTFYPFNKNKGLGRVLNFALSNAKGRYIARINQDDRMLPFRLQTQVDYLETHPDVVALGSCIKLFANKNTSQIITFLEKDEDIKRVWHIVSPFSDPSVMYVKSVATKAGGYKQKYWPADDTHLWYRMGLLGKLANLQKPVVEVRWHDEAASVAHFKKLAISTYHMHRWANTHVSKAPLPVQLFWIIQLVCGLALSPHFNWGMYRVMKKVINGMSVAKETAHLAHYRIRLAASYLL